MHTKLVFEDGASVRYVARNGIKIELDSRLSVEKALAMALENSGMKIARIEHYSDKNCEKLRESFEMIVGEQQ